MNVFKSRLVGLLAYVHATSSPQINVYIEYMYTEIHT